MSDYIWSVVIPVRNRGDWLSLCLTGIKSFTKHPYEIIIVDGCSDDPETLALFKRAKGGEFGPCKVVHLAENRSFSNAINSGCHIAKGSHFIWLNSDAIPTDGWDNALFQDLADSNVGMVGARSNAAAGAQGGEITIGDPPFLVFMAVALTRDTYELVGPMPEDLYTGWSSEDLSYSWRIKKAGKRLKLSDAYVLHGCSRSLEKAFPLRAQREKNNERYMATLIEEWGKDFVQENTRFKPKVMLVTFSSEEHTRVAFMEQMMGLRKGTAFDFDFLHITRLTIHIARQSAVEMVTNINKRLRAANMHPFTHICMVDDDQVNIPPDALMRLLKHNKDVVGTIAYQRAEPYAPCVFELAEDGVHVLPMDNIEHTGLRKVDAIGFPMVLIKMSVFDRLKEFYVNQAKEGGTTYYHTLQDERERGLCYFNWLDKALLIMQKDRIEKPRAYDWPNVGEDLFFSARCREAGIYVHVDTDIILGHLGKPVVVGEQTRKNYLARR